MTNYNDGNWWGWNGGECPVHPETVVSFELEDGFMAEGAAGELSWGDGYSYSIIAFRVVKEHKEPREFWLYDGSSFPTFYAAAKYKYHEPIGIDPIIHVREVIE